MTGQYRNDLSSTKRSSSSTKICRIPPTIVGCTKTIPSVLIFAEDESVDEHFACGSVKTAEDGAGLAMQAQTPAARDNHIEMLADSFRAILSIKKITPCTPRTYDIHKNFFKH